MAEADEQIEPADSSKTRAYYELTKPGIVPAFFLWRAEWCNSCVGNFRKTLAYLNVLLAPLQAGLEHWFEKKLAASRGRQICS